MIQEGDFLIYDTDGSWWDFFIQLISKKTHVAYAISSTHALEANASGISEIEICKCHRITVLRVKGITIEQIANGSKYAYKRKGQPYSVASALLGGILRKMGLTRSFELFPKKWDCSEYGARIIRDGMNIQFKTGIHTEDITPDDFMSSPIFRVIKSG